METLLKTPIKELIARHPAVGEILEQHGVGCVPCAVGSCLFGDVVEIHGLSGDEEARLMARIASVVFPGRAAPALPAGRSPRPRAVTYSPPVKRLVDEHRLIKRFIASIPGLIGGADLGTEEGRRRVAEGIDFIRSYADRFHHAKEEDLLFARFDQGLEILKTMREDHATGRRRVGEAVDALARRDREGVAAALAAYAQLLVEHIRKEDEILYPWLDRSLTTRQVGELFSDFRAVDNAFQDRAAKYETYVSYLEAQLHIHEEAVS